MRIAYVLVDEQIHNLAVVSFVLLPSVMCVLDTEALAKHGAIHCETHDYNMLNMNEKQCSASDTRSAYPQLHSESE
jgi:hypothetical protein